MKKILIAALVLAAPFASMAQKPAGERRAPLTPEQRAEKHTARIDKIVSLTPEQRQKVQAENLRTAQAMQPHMENMRKEREAMRTIGKQRHEAYASILTPDQMARLKEARKQHQSMRGAPGKHGERGPRPGGAEMRAPAERQ